MKPPSTPIRVGVVGTGYVSRYFVQTYDGNFDFEISHVLTRRDPATWGSYPRPDLLTHSVSELIDHADVLFECSGDPIHATNVVDAACRADLPVVTIHSEFHVTTGSYFVGKGLVTEAPGDQPGSLAMLHRRALSMGFHPLVLGNLKGFLNHNPTLQDMEYWAARNGISLDKVTSFTDGTKLQVEQTLVANGLGATIARPGLVGPRIADIDDAGRMLAEKAKKLGEPISDYVLFPDAPHGVFIVCEHDEEYRNFLRHMKMGDGPYYVLQDNIVLVHLEVGPLIRSVVRDRRVLLNNSAVPRITVASVAKRDLPAGTRIEKGAGSFDLRGIAVKIKDHPGALPIGLAQEVVVTRNVSRGDILSIHDVDIPESLALHAWLEVEGRRLGHPDTVEDSPKAS